MPTEIRHLVFRPHEVVGAIAEFHQKRKEPMPRGRVTGIAYSDPPDISAILTIQPDDLETRPVTFTLGSEILAAALIFYSINRGIPLPALAVKQLQIYDGEVGLVITKQRRG